MLNFKKIEISNICSGKSPLPNFNKICEPVYETRGKVHYVNQFTMD